MACSWGVLMGGVDGWYWWVLMGGVDGCCCAPLGSCYQFSSDQLCPFGLVGCLAPFATGFCQDHLPGTLCLRILSGLNPVFLGPAVPLWVPLLITHRVSKLLSRITHGEIKLPSLITRTSFPEGFEEPQYLVRTCK